MEEKMVFVVSILDLNGDGDDIGAFFRDADAWKLANDSYRYLTASERKNTYVCISGWVIPVKKNQSAIEAWNEAWDEMAEGVKDYGDPAYYYEIREKQE